MTPKQTKALVGALLLCGILACSSASAATGRVTTRISGCDYFLVATAKGYALLEWYGGQDPDKDDIIVGGFEEFGMHDVYDTTADEEVTVWVEDYWLTKTVGLEKLVEKCE